MYKSDDGAAMLPYSEAAAKYMNEADLAARLAAPGTAAQLIKDAGIADLDGYSHNATGDGQREILAAAIRPEGNNPSSAEILKWLASEGSSRSLNNQWPLEIYG